MTLFIKNLHVLLRNPKVYVNLDLYGMQINSYEYFEKKKRTYFQQNQVFSLKYGHKLFCLSKKNLVQPISTKIQPKPHMSKFVREIRLCLNQYFYYFMNQPQPAQDHIPLKDQFSQDESEPPSQRQEKTQKSMIADLKEKKIKKVFKKFKWALKWVKVKNVVSNSQPILIKKWVKVKLNKQEISESQQKSISKSQKDDDLQQGDAENQVDEDYSR